MPQMLKHFRPKNAKKCQLVFISGRSHSNTFAPQKWQYHSFSNNVPNVAASGSSGRTPDL
jgi:hypothetical protein